MDDYTGENKKSRFEQQTYSIAALGRDELKRRIRNFEGTFRLDFTEDYLNNLSVDRLRHILLAALINSGPRGVQKEDNLESRSEQS